MPHRLPRRLPHARPPRRATGVTVGGSRLADVVPYTGPVMCRNIRPLHNFAPPATPEEVRAAALQYVRKVAGASKPSRANEAAFLRAVDEVAGATGRLLDALVTTSPPRNREVEAAKARARAAQRFAPAAAAPS